MSYGKKLRTDLENLYFLHKINRLYNSPRIIHRQSYYPQTDIRRSNYNTRTIFLQKTNPVSYFPVCIKLLKKDRNNYSYSPNRISSYSPSYSRFNNNSFENYSFKKDKHNFNYEQNRTGNRRTNDSESLKYRNMGQIIELKHSLGNPNQARNVMVNNMGRINRFISISPSENSNKDDLKDKAYDYLKYNEMDIEENNYNDNYDDKHKIRFLLSKDYVNKLKKKKLREKNNRIRIINDNLNNIYNNKSYSFRNNYNNNVIKSNECSPENKSGNIFNNIRAKNTTPKNITPILNTSTPYIIPEDQIIQEEVQLNDNNNIGNIFLSNNNNINYKIIEIKLDDLIFIEGRLNDIILSLDNKKNVFDIGAINETVEFFVFYFHSSLKNKLPSFFMEQNRLIIKSAFNLNLFIIMITYHLSLNPSMLIKVILFLKRIYNFLRMNLFLFIRKIELYYGDEFCSKNDVYFKTCNYFLNENGLLDLYENEIINIINKNCISIVKDISNILNHYYNIRSKYFYDFNDMFLNISKISEQTINDYLYNCLLNSQKENIINQQRNDNNNYNNNYTIDNIENSNFTNQKRDNNFNDNTNYNNNLYQNRELEGNLQFLDDIIFDYKKNKEIPPFVKNKNPKKYTLVLDIDDTIMNVKMANDGKFVIRPRPGLIPFLTGIKQYYEIISFSTLSKNYATAIIQQIEDGRKLFDYNLYRDHCSLVGRKFIKDISRIGRDMKRIIMVDDVMENLNLHSDNGILILPFDGDYNKDDRVLYELKKILILFYNLKYDDLRNALKSYKDEIYEKITLGLNE